MPQRSTPKDAERPRKSIEERVHERSSAHADQAKKTFSSVCFDECTYMSMLHAECASTHTAFENRLVGGKVLDKEMTEMWFIAG